MRRMVIGLATLAVLWWLVGWASAGTVPGVAAHLAVQSVAHPGQPHGGPYRYYPPRWRYEERYYPVGYRAYVSPPYCPYYPVYPAYYPPSGGFYYAQPGYSFWIGF